MTDSEQDRIEQTRQPLVEHLRELKKRILISVISILFAFIFSYIYSDQIFSFLAKPLFEASDSVERKMIFTGLAEAFLSYIKLSFYSGLILSFPIISWQIYGFFWPGLYKNERQMAIAVIFSAPILFVLGCAFSYYFAFPAAWKFFLSFEDIKPGGISIALDARISEYLSLSILLMVAFGIACQTPLVIVILIFLRIITTEQLVRLRRYAIVIMVTVAGIITPPDILSQLLLAGLLLLWYEVGILVGKVVERSRLKA
jgi:sec-independent protein translocase protein TatC